ncbi:glycoside hydrolase family 127 protein [Acidobacteria bacterium AH-259-G07]|nr:glycoside hydrolase family 127 protein [Acidobacteria bacterium AH-259-G07]
MESPFKRAMMLTHRYLHSFQVDELAHMFRVTAGLPSSDWAKKRTDRLTDEHMQEILETELGGVNDVLAQLYAVTGNPDHLALARRFDHRRIFEPLANGRDELRGLHANTQIPKFVGAAQEYEVTGEPFYRHVASFAWETITGGRTFATGGTSNYEHWRTPPGQLASELSPWSAETCCSYNMLKLTRHLFGWDPQAKYADYYERTLYNSILASQHSEKLSLSISTLRFTWKTCPIRTTPTRNGLTAALPSPKNSKSPSSAATSGMTSFELVIRSESRLFCTATVATNSCLKRPARLRVYL